jgi:hypothetical protein
MRVMCIKKMISSDVVFSSIKVGDWIEVYEKSIYDMTNKDPNHSSCYFYSPSPSNEYAFYKSNFITLDQWREQQIEKLLDNE